jgi:hypothetical protein
MLLYLRKIMCSDTLGFLSVDIWTLFSCKAVSRRFLSPMHFTSGLACGFHGVKNFTQT